MLNPFWKDHQPVGCRPMESFICRKAVNQKSTCGWRMCGTPSNSSGEPASWAASADRWALRRRRSWVAVAQRPPWMHVSRMASGASVCTLQASISSPAKRTRGPGPQGLNAEASCPGAALEGLPQWCLSRARETGFLTTQKHILFLTYFL